MADASNPQPPASPVVEVHPLLGGLIGNYPSDRLPILIIGGWVIGVSGLLVSFTIGTLPYAWVPIPAMLIMGVVTAVVGWLGLHRWNREIVLYEGGFIYREGSKFIEFVYDEIDSLRLRAEKIAYFGGLVRRAVYRITVTTTRGEQFTITNLYRRTAELGERLQERLYRQMRPKVAQALVRGDAIRFGDTLRVSQRGFHESGRDLEWAQFGGYRIADRKLTLLGADGAVWLALPLWEYDNLPILIDLLKSQPR
ncbi:MAG: DUF6585 family protein [bacterium]|nr:DUF6585 family protein [bacterium]